METKISDIMAEKSGETFSVAPDNAVFDTIKMMVEKNIGAVLVMDNDRLEGIFTERDYMKKIILKGLASKETTVKDVMTAKVAYITPDISLQEGLAVMSEKNCRHVPVFEGQKVVGVVSIGDLAKRLIQDQKVTIDKLAEYIAGNWEK